MEQLITKNQPWKDRGNSVILVKDKKRRDGYGEDRRSHI